MHNGGEIIRGGPKIIAYINRFMDQPLTPFQIYRAIDSGQIRASKFMGQHTTTKTAIREDLSKILGLPIEE